MVVAASFLAALLLRRRSHGDVHSVEGYHRQIHTLETISEHPPGPEASDHPVDGPKHAYPESAVRLTDSTTVRLIGSGQTPVPPVAPPPVSLPPIPVTFDDTLVRPAEPGPAESSPDDNGDESSGDDNGDESSGAKPITAESGRAESSPAELSPTEGTPPDRAVSRMNRRPRRLLAPGLAVAAVTILIAVLLIAGSHTVAPPHRSAATTNHHHKSKGSDSTRVTTTTGPPPPVVSAPQSSTANAATYSVGRARSHWWSRPPRARAGSACPAPPGPISSSATLAPGETHTLPVTGPISVNVGAPSSFAATVNGAPVALPTGFQTPLTLNFAPAAAA